MGRARSEDYVKEVGGTYNAHGSGVGEIYAAARLEMSVNLHLVLQPH